MTPQEKISELRRLRDGEDEQEFAEAAHAALPALLEVAQLLVDVRDSVVEAANGSGREEAREYYIGQVDAIDAALFRLAEVKS